MMILKKETTFLGCNKLVQNEKGALKNLIVGYLSYLELALVYTIPCSNIGMGSLIDLQCLPYLLATISTKTDLMKRTSCQVWTQAFLNKENKNKLMSEGVPPFKY